VFFTTAAVVAACGKGPKRDSATEGAKMKRVTTVLALVVLLVGCAAEPAAQPEPTMPPAPAPELPPRPVPAPEPAPEPVELSAEISASEQGVLIVGNTNLPDGAVLDYDILLFGSGCLTDDCREFEELTPEQSALYSNFGVGYLTVSAGQFVIDIPDWSALPICGWQSTADWKTNLNVAFFSDERQAELMPENPGQPENVYELYGRAAERVEAAPGVELARGLSGPYVYVEVLC